MNTETPDVRTAVERLTRVEKQIVLVGAASALALVLVLAVAVSMLALILVLAFVVSRRARRAVAKAAKAGFLALVLMPTAVVMVCRARRAARVAVKAEPVSLEGVEPDLKALMQVADLKHGVRKYYIDTGLYPTPEQGLRVLVEPPAEWGGAKWWAGPYLDTTQVPLDPWGREYVYRRPGPEDAPFEVLCLGEDGVQ